jgi:uncharacterized membrane protein (DUF106 family)
MSNLINVQNAIKSVSQELVKARHEGDSEKVEELEIELANLEDEHDELIDREYGHVSWDD